MVKLSEEYNADNLSYTIIHCRLMYYSTVIFAMTSRLEWVDQPLSTLMTMSFSQATCMYPMLGLGEELIKRGHNVTLCTTIMEGSCVIPSLPEKLG